MKDTHRFTVEIEGDENSIFCFADVGGVTVSVTNIDVAKQEIIVNPRADVRDYHKSVNHPFMGGISSTRSVGYVGSMPGRLGVNQPVNVTQDGKPFVVRVIEIGEMTGERGEKRAFCVIKVEAAENESN
jgi:hypothetical protein